jgi:uncharacterized protein with von Willebrand factor type A (vWA) domain
LCYVKSSALHFTTFTHDSREFHHKKNDDEALEKWLRDLRFKICEEMQSRVESRRQREMIQMRDSSKKAKKK